jgi:hypothetical protein
MYADSLAPEFAIFGRSIDGQVETLVSGNRINECPDAFDGDGKVAGVDAENPVLPFIPG